MAQMLRPPSKLPVEGRSRRWPARPLGSTHLPLDPEGLRRKGRRRRLLHLHVRRLAQDAAVRARLGERTGIGLVVIGAPPEFSFEIDLDNVRRRYGYGASSIRSPSTTGTRSRTRRGSLLAALFFIDATGRIRHHWFGEGDYSDRRG